MFGVCAIAVSLAHFAGEGDHIEETLSTLQFATRMMRVRYDAIVNVQLDPAVLAMHSS